MNRFFTLLLAASCLTAVGQVPEYVPDFALALWYDFESDCLDCGANAPLIDDDAIENHDGYGWYLTQASTAPFGDGQAAEFGSHPVSNDSWIDVCGGNDCLLLGTNSMSVSFWIKPSQSLERQTIFTPSTGLVVDLVFETIVVQDMSDEFSLVGFDDVFDGDWHHVVYVRDCSSGMRLYVDGVLVGENESFSCTSVNAWGRASIGGQASTSGNLYFPFKGGIDDFGVWRASLSQEQVTSLWLRESGVLGCTDAEACNYNPDAVIDDGTCLGCDVFAARCGQGTVWDAASQTCIPDNPSDLNYDGCVDVNDFMGHLAAFGSGCEEGVAETPWQCGDPLEYQGYNYETVQIGEQCWFAENLRAENYRNGDAIPSDLSNGDWLSTTTGAVAVSALNLFGRLYNWYAVEDNRGLCPESWHVPTDSDWILMEVSIGMSDIEANSTSWRGTNQGEQLKATYGWDNDGNGTNLTGFGGLPGGYREPSGGFSSTGGVGYWWTSTPFETSAWYRILNSSESGVYRLDDWNQQGGLSIRCIKD